MSFNNTKTPLKPTDLTKVRYPVPMRRGKHNAMVYYLTPELEEKLRELYPKTMNAQLMQWFGLSHSTLHRFAITLGLEKDMAVIHHKHGQQVKAICRRNGYYDRLKGKRPSEATIEGTRRKRSEGFVPLHRLKELSPRRYKAYCRKLSRKRKELIEQERRRYNISLLPLTDLPVRLYAGCKYSRYESMARHNARRMGYVVGDSDPELGERMIIYYTPQTERHEAFEQSASNRGFEFRPIALRGKPVGEVPAFACNFDP